MIRAFGVVVLACVAAAGCGAAPAPSPAAAPASGLAEVTGAAPAGALVTLLPAAADAPMPEGPAVMDQYAKQFVPAVLYVRVGQLVEFRNTDNLGHNVNVHRRGTGATIFDVETDPQDKHLHTFERAGQYDVACSEHPGMQATLIAATSSLATLSDEHGRFSIAAVAAGTYRLSVTFEGRTVEQTVDVEGPRTEVRLAK